MLIQEPPLPAPPRPIRGKFQAVVSHSKLDGDVENGFRGQGMSVKIPVDVPVHGLGRPPIRARAREQRERAVGTQKVRDCRLSRARYVRVLKSAQKLA